jgi:hypothetical protein
VSQPFAQLVGRRADQRTDAELTEEAFNRFNRWSLMSSDKLVSLDEVAWVGALLLKAMKSVGVDIMKKHEARDENGARVVGIVASDGVRVADGAA